MRPAARLGARGEAAAARYLSRRGYTILERNWAAPPVGELDLVARRGGLLVVVEVRTVSTGYLSSPTQSILPEKQARVARAAARYLAQAAPAYENLRFDVIGVRQRFLRWQIEHIEDAFTPDWAF